MEIGSKTLTTIGTTIGILVGSIGMWFTLKDRMEAQIEKEVTYRIKMETKVARIEERLDSYKTDIWTLQNKTDSIQNKINENNKN